MVDGERFTDERTTVNHNEAPYPNVDDQGQLVPTQKQYDFARQHGVDPSVVDAAAAVINLTPPMDVLGVEVSDLPLGDGKMRVCREYDTDYDQFAPGYSRIKVYTVLGDFILVVNRAALVQQLTVEVPYVAPTEVAPQS